MGVIGCALDLREAPMRLLSGVRWTWCMEVAEQAGIMFWGAQLCNAQGTMDASHALEVQQMTWSMVYDDGAHGWPPRGRLLQPPPQPWFPWPALSDYGHHVDLGMRVQRGPKPAWRVNNFGVDGIVGINKLGCEPQDGATWTGRTIQTTFQRIGTRTRRRPTRAWGYRQDKQGQWFRALPPGEYTEWNIILTEPTPGRMRRQDRIVTVRVLVGPWGAFIYPREPLALITEFWERPGIRARCRVTDVAVQFADDPETWVPWTKWWRHHSTLTGDFGVRAEPGALVAEAGWGKGPDAYAVLGDTLDTA